MATDRQIQETIARRVSVMGRYHGGGRTRHTALLVAAEVQALAAWVLDLGLGPAEAEERILRPVSAELLRRYGHELGSKFNSEFLDAYEGFDAAGRAAGTFNGRM